jgi:hypothetical protein
VGKREGFFQCYNYIFRENDLSAYDKLVFCVILSLSKGGEQEVFISYETLAKFSGIKRTSAYKSIKNLIEKKYIKYGEKQKRNSKTYQVINKWTVHEVNKTSSPDEHQQFTRRKAQVHEANSINSTYLNNTPKIKKSKKEKDNALAVRCISLYNEISGSGKNINNEEHIRKCNIIIKSLRQMGSRSDDEILAKFSYVFENKKREHEDEASIWNHLNKIGTMLAKANFLNYMDEEPYKPNTMPTEAEIEEMRAKREMPRHKKNIMELENEKIANMAAQERAQP